MVITGIDKVATQTEQGSLQVQRRTAAMVSKLAPGAKMLVVFSTTVRVIQIYFFNWQRSSHGKQ